MAHMIEVTLRYECTGDVVDARRSLEQSYAPGQGRVESFGGGLSGGRCVGSSAEIIDVDPSYADD